MTLLEKVYDFENLFEAYKNCRRGKRATIGDQKFFTNYPDRLLEIQDELRANSYKWGTYREFYVIDPKKRLIMAAPFKDRIVHHAIHRVISPFIEKNLEDSVCACRIGMGNRYAVLKLKENLQKLESRYVIKLDVKKYFPSIDHKILFDDLNEVLPDKTLSKLLWTLIQSHSGYKELGRGIPIGNLTSQLFANFYLSEVDKLIVKKLGASNESAFYLRYMDDLLIVGADKSDICKISREAIKLAARRNLEIPIYKRVHLGRDAIPFLCKLGEFKMILKRVRKTSRAFGISGCAGAVLRGGNWNNDVNAGVFASNLNNAPTNTNTNIGFRCVFVPGFWVETGRFFWRARIEKARSFSSRYFLPLGNFSLPHLGHASIGRSPNTWDLKKLLTLIVFIFSFECVAREIDKVNKGDTIETIAQRNLPRVWTTHGRDVIRYAEDIKKWNANIKDWKKPPANQLIYVTYPYDSFVSGSSWAPALGLYEEPNEFNKIFYLSVFYSTSFGTYLEEIADQNIKSDQNIPVSFGIAGSLANDGKNSFLVGSLTWAQPLKGIVKGNSESQNKEFSIPGEVGGNLYFQKYNSKNGLGLQMGYDYESLNLYNTSELIGGDVVKNRKNHLHYGTAGALVNFDLFKSNFIVRGSYSHLISVKSDTGSLLTGRKYIFTLTFKPENRFSIGIFYKHHDIKSTTKLSIDRIGLNLGFTVF